MEETSQSGGLQMFLVFGFQGVLVLSERLGVDYGSIKQTAQLTGDGTLLMSDLDSPPHPQERLLVYGCGLESS